MWRQLVPGITRNGGDREGRNGRIEEEEKESPTGGDLLSVIVTGPICQRTFLAA